MSFLAAWNQAALTTLYFFYKAFWAFALGYFISSMIQVFVTREKMQQAMGKEGPRSVALGTFFGFISSSCSFAALATTKALLKKGAGLVPAMAFLLASTNLVIELGIVIAVFLSWQFVLAEYLGGILLILFSWALISGFYPKGLVERVKERLGRDQQAEAEDSGILEKMLSQKMWSRVARKYFMEWKMVWKDVTFGFTVAGIIAVMVPNAFFQWLFPGVGQESLAWWQIVLQTCIGPLAAFFTFIGSMGNIPLAAVLYTNGVSFAGVMAFIFSDLMVFPVLRINAKYYGWKMAAYLALILFIALVLSALSLHFIFDLFGSLPKQMQASGRPSPELAWDYTAILNLVFIGLSGAFALLSGKNFWQEQWSAWRSKNGGSSDWMERALFILALGSILWLAVGSLAF